MDVHAARRIKPWCFSVRYCCGAPAANISYALRIHGMPRRAAPDSCARSLATGWLRDLSKRSARLLSGGEQQRLALARVRVLKPQVLLLDEPTASLDPAATQAVERCEQISESGTKIIMTTHDLGQARRRADEVLFLHRGRLLEHGLAAEFFSRPQTKEGRRLSRWSTGVVIGTTGGGD
jgi:tungstate transport system ATP-binding protein